MDEYVDPVSFFSPMRARLPSKPTDLCRAPSTPTDPMTKIIDPAAAEPVDESIDLVAEPAAEPVDEYIDPVGLFFFPLCACLPTDGPRQVSLDGYSFNRLIEYIVSARRQGTESLISICYPASKAYDLAERLECKLVRLGQSKIRRCEYDFDTGILYLDIMPERPIHYVTQEDFKDSLKSGITAFIPTIEDATIRRRMSDVR